MLQPNHGRQKQNSITTSRLASSRVNSQHKPSRPDQRRAGELEDEFDAHVGPIPQTNYTRSGDYFIQVRNAVEYATREARNIQAALLANIHNTTTVIRQNPQTELNPGSMDVQEQKGASSWPQNLTPLIKKIHQWTWKNRLGLAR